jgi:hypothetical protein
LIDWLIAWWLIDRFKIDWWLFIYEVSHFYRKRSFAKDQYPYSYKCSTVRQYSKKMNRFVRLKRKNKRKMRNAKSMTEHRPRKTATQSPTNRQTHWRKENPRVDYL